MQLAWTCVFASFCGTTLLATDSQDTKPRPDKELIQGIWTVVSSQENGRKIPKEKTAGVRVVIDAKTISFRKNNQDPMTVQYTLDSTKTPKTIDTTHEIDPGKPISQLGIYLLKGDTLTLCIEAAGKSRPKSLEAKSGSVFVLKRRPEPNADNPQ